MGKPLRVFRETGMGTATEMDPLLAAVIGKLPPVGAEFPASARQAWLRLIVNAFDCAYGTLEAPVEVPSFLEQHAGRQYTSWKTTELIGPTEAMSILAVPADKPPARKAHAGHKFYVALDGTVCNASGTPVLMEDVDPDETIFDYRPLTSDFRDLASITWADGATGTAGIAGGISFCGPG